MRTGQLRAASCQYHHRSIVVAEMDCCNRALPRCLDSRNSKSIANAAVAESEAVKARNSALQESVAIAKYEAVRHHRSRKEKEEEEFIAEDTDADSEVARRLSAMEAAVTRLREEQSVSTLPAQPASPRARLSHPAVLRSRDHEASPSSAMSGSSFNSGGSSRMHERDVRPSRSRSASPVQYSPGRATPRIDTAAGSASRRHYRPGNSSPASFPSFHPRSSPFAPPSTVRGHSLACGLERPMTA
ncbi:hypothetical protein CYMTET_14424 [Cymbomonas tetramitiformis]|uniref:Uncharacterized protein n=1 Tax=Cymbomonas tetramitiformis TaxID=36881 RepID=A0AAE0LA65_9CHLO|nr:hypothetical protein CYMTET_14424 [Cymbomonas tetramitiformis]